MVYDHIVKYNGKFYRTGEYVPDDTDAVGKIAQDDTDAVVEMPPHFERKSETKYTKSQISTMSTADLQSLANSVGIENAFDISGRDLKKILIERFGL